MGIVRVGGEILVNTATAGNQNEQQITALSNGGFVVTWRDNSQSGGDPSLAAVRAQVFAPGGAPVGTEILVNTTTGSSQSQPQITALSNGGFVVTWRDESGSGGDTSGTAVRAQVFAAGGTTVGTEILVNTATAGNQFSPQITALSNGGFVVTWRDDSGSGGDTSGAAVRAQVFAAGGTTVGTELLVNTTTANDQYEPQITALSNGGFVVTWRDESGSGGDASLTAVRAQVFAAGGAPVGTEILVNTTTTNNQYQQQITALSNGGFVVTWRDDSGSGGDTDGAAVRAQVFAAGGAPVGTEILVNTTTADDQSEQQITALSNGGFVVTWRDDSASGGDTSLTAVRAQVFAAGGAPVGTEILVNTTTTGNQYGPQITALSNGGFVVTWRDDSGSGGDASGAAVRAQVFAAGGAPVGTEILVNTATANNQYEPQITALSNGGFAVTWTDDSASGGDTTLAAVRAQVFGFTDDGTPSPAAPPPTAGGAGDDVVVLDAEANVYAAGEGDDWVFAGAGNDTLQGNVGRDTLYGDSGDDLIHGGKDDDRVDGGIGDDLLFGDLGNDTVIGGNGADSLDGGAGNDRLDGGAGADRLQGGTGADTIDGWAGNDTVRGGQGDDVISGGGGDDWLSGDRGDDTLDGGAGADTFHIFAGSGNDRINGFSLTEGDRVMLDPGTTYALAQEGADTVLTLGSGERVILTDVALASLTDGWLFGA